MLYCRHESVAGKSPKVVVTENLFIAPVALIPYSYTLSKYYTIRITRTSSYFFQKGLTFSTMVAYLVVVSAALRL